MDIGQKENWTDILSIDIACEEKKEIRIQEFIRQIKNPYCFLCGEVLVEISFSQNASTMEEQFRLYMQQRFG